MMSSIMGKEKTEIVVIGGGVAGIAAAVQLAQSGRAVTVLESRKMLGGRAYSFYDETTQQWVDNCQHILMGCCQELRKLYRMIGVEDKIRWYNQYPFFLPNGKICELKARDSLPAPFVLLPSILKFDYLTWKERIIFIQGISEIMTTDETLAEGLDKLIFLDWLKSHGQTERIIRIFWEPIIVSALNESLDRVSTVYVFRLFKTAFMGRPDDSSMGIPSVPLKEIYHDSVFRFAKRYPLPISLDSYLENIEFENNRIQAVTLRNGIRLETEQVILALPYQQVIKYLPDVDFNSKLMQLGESAIVGIHLWFDQEFMKEEYLSVPEGFCQWIFNKNKNFLNPSQRLFNLSVVISAAQDLLNQSQEEILKQVIQDLNRIFPESQKAKLVHWRILKEHKATFSIQPGIDHHRPLNQTPYRNLWVAGDYTKTGWPSTMESAALSGFSAAQQILQRY